MISTLHRYLGKELLKTAVLAAVAFTVVMTIFAVIEPMRKQGLAPAQVLRLFGYLLPVMLSLTLPIAALFSATIVYGRFSQDNELTACRASGVSTLSLLKPALVMALIVSAASLALSNYVAPELARSGEEATRANLKGIVYHGLRTRSYFQWQGQIIHADQSDPALGVLTGVVALKPNKKDGTANFMVASRASVDFQQEGADTYVSFTLIDPVVGDQPTFALGGPARQTVGPILMREFLKESPAYYDWQTLARLKTHPHESPHVQRKLRELDQQLRMVTLYHRIAKSLNESPHEYDELVRRGVGVQERYVLRAPHAAILEGKGIELGPGQATTTAERPVVVEIYDLNDGSRKRAFHAASGRLQFHEGVTAGQATISIAMTDVLQIERPDEIEPEQTKRREADISPIDMPVSLWKGQPEMTLPELFDDDKIWPTEVDKSVAELRRYIRTNLSARINAEMHGRVAYGLGCLLLVALGAALGLLFRGGQILTAFALSCIPAMVLILLLVMGRQMVSNPRSSGQWGLVAIWGGVVILLATLAYVYRRLLRQ